MKKRNLILLFGGAVAGVACLGVQPAVAIAPFRAEFEELYIVEEGGTPEQQKLAELYNDNAKGKCWTCHANMKELGYDTAYGKLVRNSYGRALSQFLDKDNFGVERRREEPDAAKAEIQAAMKKVAEMKVNPDDPNSPTFGELMSKGELPGDGKPDAEDLEAATKKLKEEGKL